MRLGWSSVRAAGLSQQTGHYSNLTDCGRKTDRQTSLGRHKCNRENNIKMDLQELLWGRRLG